MDDLTTPPVLEESRLIRDKLQRMLVTTRLMNETHEVPTLVEQIVQYAMELTGASRGFIALYNDAHQLIDAAQQGFTSPPSTPVHAQLHPGTLDQVLESRKPLYIEKYVGATGAPQPEPSAFSLLCVPLASGEAVLGVLYVDTCNASESFTKADLDFITIFANQVVTALKNARLYEQDRATNQELAMLTHTLEERVKVRTSELEAANRALSYRAMLLETSRRVAQQITSILDLDVLLVQVVNLIREQFGYYFVGVWLMTPDKNAAVLRAGTGTVGRTLMDKAMSISIKTPSLITSVCSSGKSRIVEYVREVPDFLEVQELPNIVSEFVLPMTMGGELLGALDISSDKATLFSEVDQALLQTLTDQIAIAIRNARLYQAEITRRRLAENLEYAGRTLTSSLDLRDVPERVLDLLNTLVPYDRGMILLEHQNVLRPCAGRGFPDIARIESMGVPVTTDDIYRQLYNRRTPIIIGDTMLSPGWSQIEWLPIHRSWMGVAIIVEDRMVGMISLTRQSANAFSEEDATWVQAFTPQAAIAIQNASLYSEILALNEDLEKRVDERTEELNAVNRQLKQLDATKSNFINVAAHELRTPLTVIKGYSQMLRTFVDPANTFPLEGIESGTERLSEVVNSMLDMAKIDTQSLDMKKQPTRLREIADKIEREFRKALMERNITLQRSGFITLPVIQADAEMLTKVFHNLVVNAIKYTPDNGQITLSSRVIVDDGQESVEIVVADTGIGIDKEDQEGIFEKFYYTRDLETHSSGRTEFKAGGPGLGLSIARGIVLAHKGRIWVESDGYNEASFPGSRFYVVLPVA